MSGPRQFIGVLAARGALLAVLCSAAWGVAAQDTAPTFDRVSFSVSASREVDNDTLVAVMYAQREGQNAAPLADAVNEAVTSAVARAKQVRGVKVQTLGYRQNPVYRNQIVTAWRVQQSIRLESRDPAALSGLIAELQSGLAVESVEYTISPEARSEVENALISNAMAAYQQRAKLIASELGRATFRLVAMDVSTSSQGPSPLRMRATAMVSDAPKVSSPTLDPGVQEVTVQVNATIELELN